LAYNKNSPRGKRGLLLSERTVAWLHGKMIKITTKIADYLCQGRLFLLVMLIFIASDAVRYIHT
jgi:hypothetical protein